MRKALYYFRRTLNLAALGIAVWNLVTAAIVIFTGVISLDRNVDYLMAGFHVFLSVALTILVWNDCVETGCRLYDRSRAKFHNRR